jgi:lysophospholipase L1-like esterase
MTHELLPLLSTRRQVLGAGFVAALGSWAAIDLFESTTASASKLPVPTVPRPASTRVSVVGDSLTSGTMPYQSDAFTEAGWSRTAIDAYRSRGVRTKVKKDPHTGLTAVDAIRSTNGDSDLWVVALGTNDAGVHPRKQYPEVINQMMGHIGPAHYVLWVNVYLPAAPERQVAWNRALTDVALDRPDEMFVFDWADLAAPNEKWMATDQIHCSATGYAHRATGIARASRTLVPSEPIVFEPLRTRRPS